MPRIYKGLHWEIQFRKQVRRIRRGLTASPNGKGIIKSTQVIYKHPDKPFYICTKDLPWTRSNRKRNLKIIEDAFNLMEQSSNLSYKDAVALTANNYDLSILNKTHSKLIKKMKLTTTQTKAMGVN